MTAAIATPQVPRQHPHPSAAFHALDTVTVRGAQQENRSAGGRQSTTPQPLPRRIEATASPEHIYARTTRSRSCSAALVCNSGRIAVDRWPASTAAADFVIAYFDDQVVARFSGDGNSTGPSMCRSKIEVLMRTSICTNSQARQRANCDR